MKLAKTILSLLLCVSLMLPTFGVRAAEALTEETAILIGTADELFAFAALVQATAEADKAAGTTRTPLHAKLTADINLNPGATFAYDHTTGLVTVAKGEESCKMGSGMKGTELGNFHPVYNGLCTWEAWNNEDLTEKQLEEFRNTLIAEMNERLAALALVAWTPIGTDGSPYVGTFDGNGYTIDGLYINDAGIKYTGLFGVFGNGTRGGYTYQKGELKNLTIGENSLVVGYTKAGFKYEDGSTGAFVGKLDYDTVSDCTNHATVVGEGNYVSYYQISADHGYYEYGHVGGFAGLAIGKLQNCVNRGTIVSKASAGGIAGNIMGYDDNHGSVSFCTNYGKVYADAENDGRAGGIAVNAGGEYAERHYAGPIEACTNFGYVEGANASGIVQATSKNTKIRYCANRGSVNASRSASGIIDYMGFDGSTVEACYNAGFVGFLPDADTDGNVPHPLVGGVRVYLSGTEYKPEIHQISCCYNDKTVCPAEDSDLFGANITNIQKCYNVTTEVFRSGEPAYNMKASYVSNLWRQELPIPAEEGKIPEAYPTTDGTRRVYEVTHYCCHTDDTNKQAHKEVFYSNVSGDITDEHNPGKSGICEHCGTDLRKPIFLVAALPEAKVGKKYDETIRLDDSVPRINGNIEAIVSETDDAAYTFSNGLSGKADYSWYKGDFYSISGIPTEAGTLTFTLSATNENGTTQKTYTLKINESDPLEIDTDAKLENGTVGESYWRTLQCYSTNFEKTWSVAEDSTLPAGLTFSADGTISGEPTQAGDYTFTIVLTAGGQSTEKTFFLRVFDVGGCKHEGKTKIAGTPATCQKDGTADYYYCSICEKNLDEDGNEIGSTDNLKSASGHADKNSDGKCDYCGKNMPIFKKVTNSDGIVYGETYLFVAQIGDKYYALATPPQGKYGPSYGDYMNLCEVTPKADGSFDFNELEANKALMLRTEFAAESGELDAGTPRYGLSAIFGGKRYGLSDGNACLEMYANDPAKYGYRLTLDETGAARIGSVYQSWWSTPETADNGLLRAFEVSYNGENIPFMSLYPASYYNGKKGMYDGADMTEYPIFLYRMTDVGTTSGGISFISNGSNGSVNRDAVMEILDLTDDADLSNANGIANAVSQTVVETAIEAVENVSGSVSVQISADITAVAATAETDEKGGKTPTSVTYSVTPKITVLDADGTTLATSEIADSDLNGAPITVSLFVGFFPEQIVHYKEDGTKEYFYITWSTEAQNGAKTFEYENGFVTFTITDFSDFKILRTAEPEDGAANSLHFDGKTLTATVDKDGAYTVVLTGYEKGRLSFVQALEIDLKAGENTVEIPENVDISTVTKIFLWEALTSLRPVCEAIEI